MHRDPPHYLSTLKTTTTPKRLMWLSCRGVTRKRRDHYEQHFQAAALGATWWTARSKERKDFLESYDDAGTLWDRVEGYCAKGKRVVLFGYDLAEQMRLSQMLTHLPMRGWKLDKIVLERTAAWCLMRNDTRTLMCCDLKAWCPVTWDKIVADVAAWHDIDTEHLAGSTFGGEVCKARAVVIREAVLQILNWIEGEGLGQFRPTGSGQSFTAYRRRFITDRILVHDNVSRLADERKAMYTGRAEAWRHGLLRSGPYVEYDLHAAYANIAAECEVPTVARGEVQKPTNERLSKLMVRYAVLADVTVSTRVECVPHSIGNRTMWPIGEFRTLLWDPEIQLALNHCDKVTCHHAYLYTRAPALQNFARYVLDGMGSQTQVYGLIPRRVLKHWSRCLVGRMGLRYRAWHKFGPQDPPDVRLITYLDVDESTKTEMLLAGSQRLLLGDMVESPESLPQIPGWIMSECRRRLWDTMSTVGLQHVIYVDTDSIIVNVSQAPASYYGSSDNWGSAWIHKGTYSRLIIYGPRNIEVDSHRRVSGLPLSAQQTAPLEFTGEVMRSVKQSMRDGDLNMIVSLPRDFHLQAADLRRLHNPDGSTSPYTLEVTGQ